MRAGDLLKHRHHLIGRTILTAPFGEWPGGPAMITEIIPDKAAPEIVFQVRMGEAEIGVFKFEEVELLP